MENPAEETPTEPVIGSTLVGDTCPEPVAEAPRRRAQDYLEIVQAPLRGVGEILSRRLTLNLSGTAITMCQNQVILTVLALASLRSIGIWSWLDPHWYAVIACGAAVISIIAVLTYFWLFAHSGEPDA